jgi:hypothetical protein
MAKRITITCDLCHVELSHLNWQGKDELCDECVLLIEAAQAVAKQSVITNVPQSEILKKWREMYDEPAT